MLKNNFVLQRKKKPCFQDSFNSSYKKHEKGNIYVTFTNLSLPLAKIFANSYNKHRGDFLDA